MKSTSNAWGTSKYAYRLTLEGNNISLQRSIIRRDGNKVRPSIWLTIATDNLDDVLGLPIMGNVNIPVQRWADLNQQL